MTVATGTYACKAALMALLLLGTVNTARAQDVGTQVHESSAGSEKTQTVSPDAVGEMPQTQVTSATSEKTQTPTPSPAGENAQAQVPSAVAETSQTATPSVSRDKPVPQSGSASTPAEAKSTTADPKSTTVDLKSTSADPKNSTAHDKSKHSAYRDIAPCLSWIDYDKQPKAVILCVHGLGLHNGTYTDFGKRMSGLGYAVYAIDMHGFGSFMEAQGRQRVDFADDLQDIQATLKALHRAHKGLPVFILGESMGGAIALRACALYPDLCDGLISSVPSGDRFKQGKTDLSVALHFLEGRNKDFNVGKGVVEQATLKPELRDAWGNDPLARMNISPRELMQFQHFMNQNHEMAKLIKTRPVLFVQGCKDKLVRPEGTVELFNQLSTPDRQIDLISNAEHLIFEENQFNDEAIDTVSKWLDKHIAQASATGANVSIAAPGTAP